MIKGISGVPGSGKTYFAILQVIEKWFQFNEKILEWVPKNPKKPVTIFSNISGLKLPHINLDEYFHQKNIDYETFFTVPFMEKVIEKYGQVIILIDEAQKYFPSNYNNRDVLYFFQYHRHLGVDIVLTFQTWASITRKITDLMEFEIRAIRRSFSLMGEFRYHFFFGNERHGGKTVKPDQRVFALYKSFEAEGTGDQPRPVKKLALLCIVAVCVFFFGWKVFLSTYTPDAVAGDNASLDRVHSDAGKQPITKKERGAVALNGQAVPTTPSKPSDLVHDKYTIINCGGMWRGEDLMAIQFNGILYNIKTFPYAYLPSKKGGIVQVLIPQGNLEL